MVAVAALPAWAATDITYEALRAQSRGDATPSSLNGKTVVIGATRFGDLGFTTANEKELSFVCTSGDKSLTAKKPKPSTFSGTTVKAQGWEGTTVWTLANCQPST